MGFMSGLSQFWSIHIGRLCLTSLVVMLNSNVKWSRHGLLEKHMASLFGTWDCQSTIFLNCATPGAVCASDHLVSSGRLVRQNGRQRWTRHLTLCLVNIQDCRGHMDCGCLGKVYKIGLCPVQTQRTWPCIIRNMTSAPGVWRSESMQKTHRSNGKTNHNRRLYVLRRNRNLCDGNDIG